MLVPSLIILEIQNKSMQSTIEQVDKMQDIDFDELSPTESNR
jgi:hypothetical protein